MKNFKKFLTLVLAVMMVVSSVAFSTSAATTKFEDVDAKNEELVKAVDLLNYMGVAKGTSETTFGADEAVTRQQFALFIYRLMKGGKDAPAGAANSTKFTDLEDATYNYAIAWANAEGIVNGKSETTFAPKDGIKLQEAYAMIVRALDWEETKNLVYPFGHIEVAEQEGVELDNGLDSSVGYTDTLTRGDMAILLYNAFFAETGIEEVYTVERKIGMSDDDEDNDTWVLQEYTTNPRLCEKAFDVIEVEYKAVATPNYKFGDAEATYDLGYDAIFFEKVENSEVNAKATAAPEAAYLTAEEIGVDAKELNDYFLGEFTMFVTVEDDEIEKVLFADCNMTKKTVTDLKLGEVSSNKAESYFADSDGEAKLLSGKVTANGTEEIYVYNAPYSYAKPTYGTDSDAETKYGLRNEKNLKAISFTMTVEDETDVYTAEEAVIVEDEYDEDGSLAEDKALALATAFEQVYYDGLYEADLYDVDGDGLYDYIDYKPYMIFQVDADEDYYFDESDFTGDDNDEFGIPYIYTQEATVLGEEFANEDVVIGYVSDYENTGISVVKVAAVIKPTVDTVANYKKAAGTLTLGSGDKVDAVNAWGMLLNFLPEDLVFDAEAYNEELVADNAFFAPEILDDENELEFYVYDGVVLLTSEVDTVAKFTENLIIPTDIKAVREAPFNPDADDEVVYVYAWVDGTLKYVQVELNDDNTPWVTDGTDIDAAYLNKLCTYTVKDNIYTIYPLGVDVLDEDDDVVSEGLSTDVADLEDDKKETQVYAEIDAPKFEKITGSRFDIGFDTTVVLKSYTKIIIRVYDEDKDEYEYVEYDATSFKKSLDEDVVLENVAVVVSNNTESTSREDLVLYYAETTDLAFKGTVDKSGYRIVSGYDIGEDAEGEWRLFYELYDPYTGAKVTDVPSEQAEAKAKDLVPVETGKIVKLVDGQVDNDEDYVLNAVDAENLVWIAEVDEAEGFFVAVPYDSTLTDKDEIDAYVEESASENAAINDIYGEEIGSNFIDFDKNTVVSVVRRSDYDGSFWVDATIKLSDMSAVAKAGKDMVCYNDKATDRNGNYTTKYADYVKAYVSVDTDVEEDENPVAEFVIVVVNGGENAALDVVRA